MRPTSEEEGVSKQKYLKLSSFPKEEYPKGEVVGENIKYWYTECRNAYHPARWAPLLPEGGESDTITWF
ncbi:hypothetical protein [uncultured Bacteroides sp.]|uniref:hypothetical protein n=1 Tax=uncultured Bacteroides sp. TaxID=162156 RepID=UPI0025958C1B|nr:hypothetical protein [uncultured Bacteroides sp.]